MFVKSVTVSPSYFLIFPFVADTSQYIPFHDIDLTPSVPKAKVEVKSVTVVPSYFFTLPSAVPMRKYSPFHFMVLIVEVPGL